MIARLSFGFADYAFILQTTLLNHILTRDHGKRIAVIENEVRRSSNSLKVSDFKAVVVSYSC